MAIAIVVQAAAGYALALYRGRYPFGSFQEAKALVFVTVIVAASITLSLLVLYEAIGIGRSVGLIAFPFACLFMGAARYAKRLYVEGKNRPGEGAQNTLIYGAGFLGNSLLTRMLQDADSPYFPVGLIDDDPGQEAPAALRSPGPGPRRRPAGAHPAHPRHRAGAGLRQRRGVRCPADLRRRRRAERQGAGPASAPGHARRRRTRRFLRFPRRGGRGPDRAPAGGHQGRRDCGLHQGQTRPGHRRRRLHRLRAVPADRPVLSGGTHHARP